MTNLAQMMQKAQMMKEKMTEMQQKAMEREVTGEAGAGMVAVTMNGRGELRAVKLEKGIVNPDDVEVLEDLIIAAVNDARKKAEQAIAEETAKIMEELGLPPDMDLPM
ncbi:MAG: YbaB/EbfC family nucleoid-associated protein [Micavibrio sp.]|nr:MAG: YbaB/EbfC family nucleoid-associated protein [Micavibrio sp.]